VKTRRPTQQYNNII